MVSFEGSLFHGGEPIVRGTRYVIAAFLYVDETRAAAQRHGAAAAANEPPCGSEEADARVVAATLARLRPLVTPPSEEESQSKRPRLEAGPGKNRHRVDEGPMSREAAGRVSWIQESPDGRTQLVR